MKIIIAILGFLVFVSATLATEKSRTILGPNPRVSTTPVTVPNGSRSNVIFESFEDDFPPVGWTTMTSGESYPWVQSDELAYSGLFSAYIQWGPQGCWQDEWLVTPAIDTSGNTTLFLEFFETGSFWSSFGFAHEVLVSTTAPDDPAAFTPLWSVTPLDYDAPWLDSGGGEWSRVDLSLADYVGETIYVAIRYLGEWADDWWVDDFHIYEPSDHDVKAEAVMPDCAVWYEDQEITPQFKVRNIGANQEAFAAEMVIEHEGVPFYSETIDVTLESREELIIDYPIFVTEIGIYNLTGTAYLVDDEELSNNVATASDNCYHAGNRTPFGILYTEWGCVPGVGANQALDAWYPLQGNTASLIRVHVWFPAGDDPMYLANPEQNTFLAEMCPSPVVGVPTLYMDNTHDMWDYDQGYWPATIEYGYMLSASTPSLLTMEIDYDGDASEAHVLINVEQELPDGDFVLYVAVTEDGVEAQGNSGEPIHNQVFRWLYPDEGGVPIANELGVQEFIVPLDLNADWVLDNLRATTWAQQVPGGAVQNSATMFLSEGTLRFHDEVVGVVDPQDAPQWVTGLQGAHPNPFNPQTTITFRLDRPQRAEIAVYDLNGNLLNVLANRIYAAGNHSVVWDGKDANDRAVPSGTYVVRSATESSSETIKVTLLK